jgi:two-component system, NtrC family, sensor histidine kinase PilS
LFFLSLLGLYSSDIILEGAAYEAIDLFFISSVIMIGQSLLLFNKDDRISLFALLLSDGALIMSLVKVSGASSSPFLTLFPLLGLSGALLFQARFAMILILACTLYIGEALSWGLTVVWNWTALFIVGALGIYLVRALRSSGQALAQSENARRRLETLQKAILANIPSGLISVDTEGRIIQMNRVAEDILGHHESHIVMADIQKILPSLELESEASLSGFTRSRPLVDYIHPDGRRLKVGYTTTPLADADSGKNLGRLIVFQDLTGVIQLEEDLRKSERLAAVGKLAAGIAHEIRNPLAGITGSAQLLIGATELGEEDRKLLSIIKKESGRLDFLISDFLDYVRPPKVELDRVDLPVVVKDSVEAIQNHPLMANGRVTVKYWQDGSGPIVVNGDANKVKQVLINLFINAAQASATEIELSFNAEGTLRVMDNGLGVEKKAMGRLFEPFFTTKEKGTGLGLAISYRLLEAMGAGIKVVSPIHDNSEKPGTMFIIDFKGATNGSR